MGFLFFFFCSYYKYKIPLGFLLQPDSGGLNLYKQEIHQQLTFPLGINISYLQSILTDSKKTFVIGYAALRMVECLNCTLSSVFCLL